MYFFGLESVNCSMQLWHKCVKWALTAPTLQTCKPPFQRNAFSVHIFSYQPSSVEKWSDPHSGGASGVCKPCVVWPGLSSLLFANAELDLAHAWHILCFVQRTTQQWLAQWAFQCKLFPKIYHFFIHGFCSTLYVSFSTVPVYNFLWVWWVQQNPPAHWDIS